MSTYKHVYYGIHQSTISTSVSTAVKACEVPGDELWLVHCLYVIGVTGDRTCTYATLYDNRLGAGAPIITQTAATYMEATLEKFPKALKLDAGQQIKIGYSAGGTTDGTATFRIIVDKYQKID